MFCKSLHHKRLRRHRSLNTWIWRIHSVHIFSAEKHASAFIVFIKKYLKIAVMQNGRGRHQRPM